VATLATWVEPVFYMPPMSMLDDGTILH